MMYYDFPLYRPPAEADNMIIKTTLGCSRNRVSLYATAQNFLEKSVEELKELRAGGLSLAYFGIETGNDKLLNKIDKG